MPIYFEVDGFLDFLFRHHRDRISKPFKDEPHRKLNETQRRNEIRTLAQKFKPWAEQNRTDGQWRLTHSKLIQDVLSRDRIKDLSPAGIRQVVEALNCMNDARQRNRFLTNNSAKSVKQAWTNLLYGKQPLLERRSMCAESLFSFKRSSVQELLGFYDPRTYPIRNLPVNAGLRFFGFDISAD
jgi:hypothetical protein